MKRLGFVSNSSSSSFIIGVKGDLTKEKLLKEFKVPEDSPLFEFIKDLAKVIVKNSEEISYSSYEKEWGEDDVPEIAKKIKYKEMKMYRGYASDDPGMGTENALCEMTIDYESEDLIMQKKNGY